MPANTDPTVPRAATAPGPVDRAALLDALQAGAPIGLGVLDAELRFTEVNHELARIAGGSPADHLGRQLDEVLPELEATAPGQLRDVRDGGGRVTDLELSGIERSGSVRHCLVSLFPVTLEEYQVGVGLVVHDVSERVEQARRTERSEARLAEAEQIAHIGSWELRGDPPVGHWSPEVSRILGVGKDMELSVDSWIEYVHPADRVRVEATIAHCADSGEPVDSRHRIVRPDGSERAVEFRAARGRAPDGSLERLYGTVQDVTDRALAEQRARWWSEAVDHMPVGLVIWAVDEPGDPDSFRLVELNHAALSSFTAGDVIIRRLAELADERQDDRGAAFAHALRERQAVELGDISVSGDDGGRMLRVRVFPLPGDWFGATLEDVTAHRRFRAQRAELIQRSVDAANAERERLASQLHDDVVQLLTAALLRLDLASMDAEDDTFADIREPLDEAVRSLRRTMLELAPASLAADGLEAAIDAYAERLLETDGVAVALGVELGDVSRIPSATLLTANRIVQEAISNVHRHADASQVSIRVWRADDELVGEVIDDGHGIREGQRPDAGRLGLRLMQDRANVVGGSVRIRRRGADGGTEVSFRLPLNDS